MDNNERDEKFLKSWLKKKISIRTSTVVSFLITGAIGGGTVYGAAENSTGSGVVDTIAVGTESNLTNGGVVAIEHKAGAENYMPGNTSHNDIVIDSSQGDGEQSITKGADTVVENNVDDIYKNLTENTAGLRPDTYSGTKAREGAVYLGIKAESGDLTTALGNLSQTVAINSVAFDKAASEHQLENIVSEELLATSTDVTIDSQLPSVAKKLSEDINSKFIKLSDNENDLNDGATANNTIEIGTNASKKIESGVSLGEGANIVSGITKDKRGTLLQTTISTDSGVAISTTPQQLDKAKGIKFNIVGKNGITAKATGDKDTTNTIDANIKLKYKSNSNVATAQGVKLSEELGLKNKTVTSANIDSKEVVKHDVKTVTVATIDEKAKVPTVAKAEELKFNEKEENTTVSKKLNERLEVAVGADNTKKINIKLGRELIGLKSTELKNQVEDKKITNVTEVENVSQPYKLAINTIQLGVANVKAPQQLNKAKGIKFNIVGKNGITAKATGDKDTTNTIDANIKLKYKSNSNIATVQGVKLSEELGLKNKTVTSASVDAKEVVKHDVKTATLATTDEKVKVSTVAKVEELKFNEKEANTTVSKKLNERLEVAVGADNTKQFDNKTASIVDNTKKINIKLGRELIGLKSTELKNPVEDKTIINRDVAISADTQQLNKDGEIKFHIIGNNAIITEAKDDKIIVKDIKERNESVATLDDAMKYSGDTGATNNKKLNQKVNVVGGITDTNKIAINENIGVVSESSNDLKVRLAKDLDELETVAVRDDVENTRVVKEEELAITSPSGSGNTVTLSNDGLDNARNIVKIVQVNNKVDKLGESVNKGVIGLAIIARLEFMDIGVRQATVGEHRGTHAVAVGAQVVPNENKRENSKVVVTPRSHSETIYSVETSYRFNWR
ncbi:hypothetical protein [uncultured Fusobacterium sp.]|uniref:hypothetical protein n=1 Tax=uncultured Fusobacterium sp. TaxID=159267 RepID=UPI00260F0F58|nr:hypothetical protein [uncultured Fusobacterium sp.]